MEVERYKMIYTKNLSILFENDNIRILGNDFVKNNKNKGKLIINTIFLFFIINKRDN